MIPTSTNEARAVEPSPQAIKNRDSLLSAYRTEIAIAVAMVILALAVGSQVPQALSWGNFSNITQAGAPLIIMSLGVLLVVITGGIDLSVGSVFSLTGMVTAQVMASGYGGITASLAGLAVGLLFGSINGFLVTVAGLAPFVVTLITFAVAGSLAFIVTNGRSMPIPDPDYWLLNAGSIVPGIPNYILFCVVLLVAIEIFLKKVVAGRWFYAVGSSAAAAYLLGIPVKRTKFFAYVASSLLSSFSGLLTISYILNAESTAGASLMLQAIAAVVIGGASLLGGTGTAVGAVLGALMITVIQNGVNLIGINSFWQGSVTGLAILIAVLIDRFGKARRSAG
ncbi:ribose transport system permease protein [Rhizobium leguminosarum]|uniref:Ribose transport system permease protein n=1 Tax=Rhizobium leguminosarum TaxID=384 RepID=A0AAE2MQ35_RHILE|nr:MULTISPECIES: ABC transporter permease [Rhizobium]MBB4293195.1 ribose transport system permease protein [Rhizobium leguminosarum]MBB4299982.1 ribose transport system permease protein [Rhizobium leguminosarum]MBB4311108.1 ribose transport system permease protein [Rhizobium leguminosarum]MBB4435335.1 ribose transport system permease protein [Rhizobium esperanzae]MBB4532267.1 ribose transport system permease protein [Rhizobium leguminosarum]